MRRWLLEMGPVRRKARAPFLEQVVLRHFSTRIALAIRGDGTPRVSDRTHRRFDKRCVLAHRVSYAGG